MGRVRGKSKVNPTRDMGAWRKRKQAALWLIGEEPVVDQEVVYGTA